MIKKKILNLARLCLDAPLYKQTEEIFSTPLLRNVFFWGLAVRLFLVLQGQLFAPDHVSYEDIDYTVISDGAWYLVHFSSPYDRLTFRYPPLLAWLMVPNILLIRAAGKLIFITCDILVCLITKEVVEVETGRPMSTALQVMALFNPLVLNSSTRGSFDIIVSLVVMLAGYSAMKRQYALSALFLGLGIHLKIYPFVFAVPLYFFVSRKREERNWLRAVCGRSMFARERLAFMLVAVGTVVALTALFFVLNGWRFIEEAYLYHSTRVDPRHNFSMLYYHEYFNYEAMKMTGGAAYLQRSLAFLCQMGLIGAAGLLFFRDVFFALFVQAFLFVAYNRVLTA